MKFKILSMIACLMLAVGVKASKFTRSDFDECTNYIRQFQNTNEVLIRKHKEAFDLNYCVPSGLRQFRLESGVDVIINLKDLSALDSSYWYNSGEYSDIELSDTFKEIILIGPTNRYLKIQAKKVVGQNCSCRFSNHKEALEMSLAQIREQPVFFNNNLHTLKITEFCDAYSESVKNLLLYESGSYITSMINIRYTSVDNIGQDYHAYLPDNNPYSLSCGSEILLFTFKVVPTARDF